MRRRVGENGEFHLLTFCHIVDMTLHMAPSTTTSAIFSGLDLRYLDLRTNDRYTARNETSDVGRSGML